MNKATKVFSLLMAVFMIVSFSACTASKSDSSASDEAKAVKTVSQKKGDSLSAGLVVESEPDKSSGDWSEIDVLGSGMQEVTTREYSVDKSEIVVAAPEKGKTSNEFEINVQNDNVVFRNFMGICCNVFPHSTAGFVSQKVNASSSQNYYPAYEEIMTKRWNTVNFAYARSWFQIDYMVTNEMGDSYKNVVNNIDKNKDYQNYKNGIYDMESDLMKACWDYWTGLETAGTQIYLAFGWKVGTRVQSWFCADLDNVNHGNDIVKARIGAPRDLKLYANAAVALFEYARKVRKLTNFNTLAFYNEVDRADNWTFDESWDYATVGDKASYYGRMLVECSNAMKANPDTKDVEIFSADCQNNILYGDGSKTMINKYNNATYDCINEDLTGGDNFVNPYLRKYYHNYLTGYTFHYYYSNLSPIYNYSKGENQYSKGYHWLYTDLSQAYQFYDGANKKLMLTEINFSHPQQTKTMTVESGNRYGYGYDGTCASSVIGVANTGFKACFVWSSGSALMLPDPNNAFAYNELKSTSNEILTWPFPKNESNLKITYPLYYEYALINNYVKHKSNVVKCDWKNQNMRCAAFTTKNNDDFTLLVATNMTVTQRNVTVNLTKSLGGRTINVFNVNDKPNCTEQGTIPAKKATIANVKDKFTYDMGNTGYGVWIFTTCNPVKQLEVNGGISQTCAAKSSINLSVKGIDCDPASEGVVWEVKRYSNNAKDSYKRHTSRTSGVGTISGSGANVKYTFPSDSSAGDVVAIRAYLKNNPQCFTSVVVTAK